MRATGGQWQVFVVMLLSGAAGGAWLCLTEYIKRRMEAGRLLFLLCDAAFALGAAAVYMAFSLRASWGEARWYQLIAWLIGLALFMAGPRVPLLLAVRAAGRLAGRACGTKIWQKIFK